MLQEAVEEDISAAQVLPVPIRFVTVVERRGEVNSIEGAISFDHYSERLRDGSHFDLSEELLEAIGAPPDPLVCITPVGDGVAVIDGVTRFGVGPRTQETDDGRAGGRQGAARVFSANRFLASGAGVAGAVSALETPLAPRGGCGA